MVESTKMNSGELKRKKEKKTKKKLSSPDKKK